MSASRLLADYIETLIAEFSKQIQASKAALTLLCQEKTAQLRQLKAELTIETAKALEEVERTLGEERPVLSSLYGNVIREMVEKFQLEGNETEECFGRKQTGTWFTIEATMPETSREFPTLPSSRSEDTSPGRSPCAIPLPSAEFESLSSDMKKAVKQEMQLIELLGLLPGEEYNECNEVAEQVKLLCKGLNAGSVHLQHCLHVCFDQVLTVSDYIASSLSPDSKVSFQEAIESIKRDQGIEGERMDQLVAVLELQAGLKQEWELSQIQVCQETPAMIECALQTLVTHSRYLDLFIPAGEAKQRSVAAFNELESVLNSATPLKAPLLPSILQCLTTQQTLLTPFAFTEDYTETSSESATTDWPKANFKKVSAVPSALDRFDKGMVYLLKDVGVLEKILEISAGSDTVPTQNGKLERLMQLQTLIHNRLSHISSNLAASTHISKGMDLLLLVAGQIYYMMSGKFMNAEEMQEIGASCGQEKLLKQEAVLFNELQGVWKAVEAGRFVSEGESRQLEELSERSWEVMGAFLLEVKKDTESPQRAHALQFRTILSNFSSLEDHAYFLRTEQATALSLLSRLREALETILGKFAGDWSAVSDSSLCDQLLVLIRHVEGSSFQSPETPIQPTTALQSLLTLSDNCEISEKLRQGDIIGAAETGVRTWLAERYIWKQALASYAERFAVDYSAQIPKMGLVSLLQADRTSHRRSRSLESELLSLLADTQTRKYKPAYSNPYINCRRLRPVHV